MADINALAALLRQGGASIKNGLMGLMKPGDVMSPQERAAYAQSTGEDIQGNAIPQETQPQQANYGYNQPQQTVDPAEVARYLAARKAQHDALMQQRGM